MSDLYLIAHKVRGEATFDIAERMVCPECLGMNCAECDQQGYWWIVGTSGWRAYPYNWASYEFDALLPPGNEMPDDLPDHFPPRSAPATPRIDILSLMPKAPSGPTIRRRL